MKLEEREKACKEVERVLTALDIEMEVGGCGCCGSPWVTFKYKGKTILEDEDDYEINSMLNKEEEQWREDSKKEDCEERETS